MSSYARERQVKEFERQLGEEALARQTREASERYVCCGERRDSGHHPCCAEYVEPAAVQEEALF